MASTGSSELSHTEFQSRIDFQKIRDLVRCYTDRHQLESALFWANKLATLSKGELQDVYSYANLLYLTGQYQRAIHQLKTFRLDRLLIGRYLTARCHFAAKDYQEALNVLDQIESGGRTVGKSCTSSKNLQKDLQGIFTHNIESAIELLRGHVLEALENRSLAVECYREALMLDVHCYEALDCLIQHHMLTAFEEQQLLDSLPVAQQCTPEEAELVHFCYSNILKKYDRTAEMTSSQLVAAMAENSDVRVVTAEHHYHNCDFQLCYNVTSQLLSDDPYNLRCLPIHVAVLVELKKLNELFYIAHKLIDINPSSAVSWFAVGCYYLASNKHELARRYLSKSTSLNRVFGPAWIAYGHSFAAENEHDQAMAAYFTASQLMKGCHLPLLYVGLEYGLTNNSKLAERFFNQALLMAPESPFILHEIGVIAFQSQEYEKAEQYFVLALEKLRCSGAQTVTVKKWEPLLNNLGHVSRKLKKYEEALNYHRQSLVLCPHNSSTLSAMGYVHALCGNFSQAVDCFHKALGLKKDDTFSTTMLNNTIEQLVSETQPVAEMPGALPKYQYHGRLGEVTPSHSGLHTTDLECSDELSLMSSRRNDDSGSLLDAEMEEV